MRGGPEAASEDMIPQEKGGLWGGLGRGGGGVAKVFLLPKLSSQRKSHFPWGSCWTHSASEKNP